MEFKIKNQELEKIDAEIFNLNKLYGMALHSLNNFPNIHVAKEVTKEIEALKAKLEKIKTKEPFEKLVIENYLKNLDSQKAYLLYFTTGEKEKIDSMFAIMLGKNALGIIKQNINGFNYKDLWDYYLSYQEYVYRQIPSDDESLREIFKTILSNLKKDLLAYAEKHFNFPKDYEFDLVLGQPYSQETSFNPSLRRMEISPSRFFVFKDKGQVKINLWNVIDVLFHELMGHGRQELNSRGMPLGIQDNSINTSVPPLHIHAEGVSKLTKDAAIKFMKEFSGKYNIEEDYIRQAKLSSSSSVTANFWIFYQYLELKSLENKSSDAEKEFLKLTGNRGLYVLYSSSKESPLSCIKNATYPMGEYYLNILLEELKKELGSEAFENNHALINEAISVGLWHFDVLPKFVRMFLKGRGL